MLPRRRRLTPEKREAILAEVRRNRALREQGYREQALRLFPHLCTRCGREFSGKDLRDLTVHHKDGDHMNNPPDGGNWELLCIYCHDDEHQSPEQRGSFTGASTGSAPETPLTFQAFEGLKHLLAPQPEPSDKTEPDTKD